MLLSTPIGCPPSLISGFGALPTVSEPLKKLQTELVKLSTATHNAAINPGSTEGRLVNGLPEDRTMGAVAASLALITPHLPSWAAIALSIGFGLGASTDRAKQAVLDYAGELSKAVIAATVTAPYYTKAPEAPTTTTPTIFKTSGPWYTTWWGIGSIAVGLVGVLALVAARRAA